MSSLAAVQADGYYINPAAYNPAAKRGSANAIAGSHALGVRANRLYTEGIVRVLSLVVPQLIPLSQTLLDVRIAARHSI